MRRRRCDEDLFYRRPVGVAIAIAQRGPRCVDRRGVICLAMCAWERAGDVYVVGGAACGIMVRVQSPGTLRVEARAWCRASRSVGWATLLEGRRYPETRSTKGDRNEGGMRVDL